MLLLFRSTWSSPGSFRLGRLRGWWRGWRVAFRGRGRVHGLDKSKAQRHQPLLQETRLIFAEVSFGLGLEHLQLIDEHPRSVQVLNGLPGFWVRDLAHEH